MQHPIPIKSVSVNNWSEPSPLCSRSLVRFPGWAPKPTFLLHFPLRHVGPSRQPHPAPLLGLGPDPLGAAHRPRAIDSIRRLRSVPVSARPVFTLSLFSEIAGNVFIL
jgi:hypothetical protein